MNVSSAKRNIPKDIKSLKSKFFFISITSILCRIEVNHPVSRLPVAIATSNIIAQKTLEHKFENVFLESFAMGVAKRYTESNWTITNSKLAEVIMAFDFKKI